MSSYNFCAGPAMLPADVMKQAQQEFIDWQGQGCSVMEISHRSAAFIELAAQAEQDLRELMTIPDDYAVLFCHGGGRGQFSAIPQNLSQSGQAADYLVSGAWSKSAVDEAKKYVDVNIAATIGFTDEEWKAPEQNTWSLSENAAYFHYCPNETVDGIKMPYIPQNIKAPLVADLSSMILSEPVDVEKFGLIYAGAQKNIGPSGLSVVIVRRDLLGNARANTPSIMDYQLLDKHDSMFNTPPTYAWYLAGLVFKWLKEQGGVEKMHQLNQQKAQLLYQTIDQSDFYNNRVPVEYRSLMNVPFQLADSSLDSAFLQQAEQQGLLALKGHRMVGGMRASIYNAMPLSGVQALTDFMQDFVRRMG
ncbi:3-phosphoserine/phosphohydroxythreonine transaminase [Neptunicella marina]|uniref:Phosphoserine aminotransferase n=1 Tax=Neptunicella marina TaxID=2125989 RepID=A0A8J6IQP6_9ALTE|nr:3-phosphoserine/phosphohydroxythreonine transaminase [Neptunicella marina]